MEYSLKLLGCNINSIDILILVSLLEFTKCSLNLALLVGRKFVTKVLQALLSLEDHKVLSEAGVPIKLHIVPDDIAKIKISDDGKISVFNDKTRKLEGVATLGIVDSHGLLVEEPIIKQGYCEFSNVAMANEFMEMMPIIRNFEANRQMFLIQNQNLQKLISQLGQQ